MADITMCKHNECEKKNECYRYLAKAQVIGQVYFAEPEKDCVDNDYKLFWECLHKKNITD